MAEIRNGSPARSNGSGTRGRGPAACWHGLELTFPNVCVHSYMRRTYDNIYSNVNWVCLFCLVFFLVFDLFGRSRAPSAERTVTIWRRTQNGRSSGRGWPTSYFFRYCDLRRLRITSYTSNVLRRVTYRMRYKRIKETPKRCKTRKQNQSSSGAHSGFSFDQIVLLRQ